MILETCSRESCVQLVDGLRAALQERDAEIANLHTTMMAAAVEINEHWDAHCDAEGYGPCNLVRRLENGFPAQYGYDAKTVVRMDAQLAAQRKVLEQALEALQLHVTQYPHMQKGYTVDAITAIQGVLK